MENIIIGFLDFLKGKKTYIIAILMILLGFLNNDQKLILEGLGLFTLRAGVSKVKQFMGSFLRAILVIAFAIFLWLLFAETDTITIQNCSIYKGLKDCVQYK